MTQRTIYLLDEPTVGLHYDDVAKLIEVLDKLVVHGNSVIIIEHNLDLIKVCDYIIDLGPEGGETGGYVTFTGTPEEMVKLTDGNYTAEYLKGKV